VQKLVDDFKDRVNFLFVYIREAHPSDSNWADPKVELKDPKSDEERSEAAKKCASALSMKIPSVVDGLDDGVNMKYCAWPERMYVIGLDGKIAYKGAPGPFGFKPKEARAALEKVLGK